MREPARRPFRAFSLALLSDEPGRLWMISRCMLRRARFLFLYLTMLFATSSRGGDDSTSVSQIFRRLHRSLYASPAFPRKTRMFRFTKVARSPRPAPTELSYARPDAHRLRTTRLPLSPFSSSDSIVIYGASTFSQNYKRCVDTKQNASNHREKKGIDSQRKTQAFDSETIARPRVRFMGSLPCSKFEVLG